jgi:hypothetical protein
VLWDQRRTSRSASGTHALMRVWSPKSLEAATFTKQEIGNPYTVYLLHILILRNEINGCIQANTDWKWMEMGYPIYGNVWHDQSWEGSRVAYVKTKSCPIERIESVLEALMGEKHIVDDLTTVKNRDVSLVALSWKWQVEYIKTLHGCESKLGTPNMWDGFYSKLPNRPFYLTHIPMGIPLVMRDPKAIPFHSYYISIYIIYICIHIYIYSTHIINYNQCSG